MTQRINQPERWISSFITKVRIMYDAMLQKGSERLR